MKKSIKLIFVNCVLMLSLSGCFSNKETNSSSKSFTPLGYGYKPKKSIAQAKSTISNFALLTHQGVFWELFNQRDVEFLTIINQSSSCLTLKKYAEQINSSSINPSQQIVFLNSDSDQTRMNLINESNLYANKIPILMDPTQTIANILKIVDHNTITVISTKNWSVLKQVNLNASNLKKILSLKFNEEFIEENVCKIKKEIVKKISYEKEIAPILQNKCLSCHFPGKGYPPNLNSYELVKNWREMSKETILTQRMPPISFDPLYGEYSNDISLTNSEKKLLINWYNQGAPNDSSVDPLVSYRPTKKIKHNFQSKPIYVAQMNKPHSIPPEGDNIYKYFQLGDAVPTDLWVSSYRTSSTNPRQLHHESVMVVTKPLSFYESLAEKMFEKQLKRTDIKDEDGNVYIFTLAAMQKYEKRYFPDRYIRIQNWASGKNPNITLPDNKRIFIPKGSYLILEAHYMGTGVAEEESTKVEFWGTTSKPANAKIVHTQNIGSTTIEIPPNTKFFDIKSNYWSPRKDIYIHSFLGHLHMRGKAIRMELTNSKNEMRPIVSIPNFYYGWQTGSGLTPKNPILVKISDKLQTICNFDNSINNPYNPDPSKHVSFGQRVDRSEMCKIGFSYTYVED